MQKALASASPARYRIFMKRVGSRIRGLINASGGIGYHLAALRFAAHLWQPFREDLGRELAARLPGAEAIDLVLVGTSGGYCLDPAFFFRFRSIIAVDIDPLAGSILRSRLGVDLRFVRQDFFRKLESEHWDLERWLSSIGAPSGATILFSNVLGQLGFLHDEVRLAEIAEGLYRALESPARWLSFHDRFSVRLGTSPRVALNFPARPESRELADAWTAKWGKGMHVAEIEEHEIGNWIERASGSFAYLPWSIDSRRTQLIEIAGGGL
jgi:hypothetical protein